MKSTNVRQLMNLLSQKYFGNELPHTSTKPQRSTVKVQNKNEQSAFNILSPVASCKTSPKFNRACSSQGKSNQNINYFEQTRNYFEQTRAKLKRPDSQVLRATNERKRLQLRNTNEADSSSQVEQSQNDSKSYTRKYSHKELLSNNSGTYLSPVTFSNISTYEPKNSNSRLIKQTIKDDKTAHKRLFLKQNSSQLNKLQSNSTISNSRSSFNIKRQSEQRQVPNKRQEQMRQRQELEFYRQKCSQLQHQNSELQDKVSTYEEQFAQEKLLVQNLKNMMSRREEEINQIIEKKLGAFSKKQHILQTLEEQNQTLRKELDEVRKVLRQQESIIMELYAKNKQRPNQIQEQKPTNISSKTKMQINFVPKTITSSNCSTKSTQNRPYALSYLDSNARQSIAQTSYEDDEFRMR